MVDYNFTLPQQQFVQPPDPLQNYMRMQQLQAGAMQMQQAQRTQQQQNALAELMGSGGDMSSPEFRQKMLAVGGASAAPILASIATMTKEDIARKAEEARTARYQSQAQTSDLERKLKLAEHFRDQIPAVLSSADPATSWSKWQSAAKAALGDTFSAPEQYPGEEAARGYMMKASDAIKSAQEQLQVMSGPGGVPVFANKKTGTFQMGTEAGARAPSAPAAAGAPAAGFDMNRAKQAIAGIESGGKYDALGPITRNGDRAFGKYQVMGANIPAWTKEALGQSMTPAEFLASPEAQERVFETQFGKSVAKYGNPADAASVWFSGRPLAKAGNAADVLGTTVPQYAQKFMAAYEGGANTPANMRAPGFASSTGIPANVGLPVQPVLNALAGAQPQQPVNALAAPPQMAMAPQPAPMSFRQAQAEADKRERENRSIAVTEETLARERAQAQVKAEQAAPKMEATVREISKEIEGLIGSARVDEKGRIIYAPKGAKAHPGFESSVGASISKVLPGGALPGTSRADFEARFNQLQGGAFLDAYNMLRGGGSITEKEGEKATAARNRMNLAQSEVEFVRAARDFESAIKEGLAILKDAAGGKPGGGGATTPTATTKPSERQVVRSGTYNGRRVVQYSDGTTDYAD